MNMENEKSVDVKDVAIKNAEIMVKDYGVTSVEYALIDSGEIVLSDYAGVYSKLEEKSLTNETMYGIGSTSKIYTAAAVMKLVDMGKINLDKSITEYIKQFKMADERYKDITVRMLLNHSSGLKGTGLSNSIVLGHLEVLDKKSLFKLLEEQKLIASPGKFSVYCNDGFTLAQIIVENVSKMDFNKFIYKYFIKPLGLKNTKIPMKNVENKALAKGYMPKYEGELLDEVVKPIGAGGIYSTAEDMCRFSEIFMKKNVGIISNESIMAMANEEYNLGLWRKEKDNIFGYGLGWDNVSSYPFNEYGMKVLKKGGDTMIFHNMLLVLPEYNMAVDVVTSGGSSIMNEQMAINILLKALKEKGIIEEIKEPKEIKTPIKVSMPKEMVDYSGIYGDSLSESKIDIKEDGSLFMDNGSIGHMEATYVYTKEGIFVKEDGRSEIKFVKEKNNHIYIYERRYISFGKMGTMVCAVYAKEKFEENILTKEVSKAWENRNGKKYLIVNESYASIFYLFQTEILITLNKNTLGYFKGNKIVNENKAEAVAEIPMIAGRDLQDKTFYKEDGIEYMKSAGYIFMSEEGVKSLNLKKYTYININKDGYAKWFNIDEKSSGKKITLKAEEKSNVIVYDEKGMCLFSSYISSKNKVKLPLKGKIVFLGKPDTVFKVTIDN